jgi:phage N-6-adenine-methyltransferase
MSMSTIVTIDLPADNEFKPRKMPAQKPGTSKQDYETPDDFIAAVEAGYGKLDVDLAATPENARAPHWLDPELDSLQFDWTKNLGREKTYADKSLPSQLRRANWWLNPPFSNIARWTRKISQATQAMRTDGGYRPRVLLLTPASVGANWFRDDVHGKALVLALNGRLTFRGETQPYPKDCMLSVWGEEPGFQVWNWRTQNVPRS